MSKRYLGKCVVCGRQLTVRKNGTIGEHQSYKLGAGNHGYCFGIDLPPIESTNVGLQEAITNAENHAYRLKRKIKDPSDHWSAEFLTELKLEQSATVDFVKELKVKLKNWKPGTLEETKPAPARKDYGSGTCCVCNRVFKIKKDGTLRSHNYHPETILSHRYCFGDGLRPLEATNEDCIRAIELLNKDRARIEKKLADPDPDTTFEKDKRVSKAELHEIQFRVYQRYAENTKRNYELWSPENPIPRDPLPPITDQPRTHDSPPAKMNSRNTVTVEVGKSGCLGMVLLMTAIPLFSLLLIR